MNSNCNFKIKCLFLKIFFVQALVYSSLDSLRSRRRRVGGRKDGGEGGEGGKDVGEGGKGGDINTMRSVTSADPKTPIGI